MEIVVERFFAAIAGSDSNGFDDVGYEHAYIVLLPERRQPAQYVEDHRNNVFPDDDDDLNLGREVYYVRPSQIDLAPRTCLLKGLGFTHGHARNAHFGECVPELVEIGGLHDHLHALQGAGTPRRMTQ